MGDHMIQCKQLFLLTFVMICVLSSNVMANNEFTYILIHCDDIAHNLFIEVKVNDQKLYFNGDKLTYRFDKARNTYHITGIGSIRYENITIYKNADSIVVNKFRLDKSTLNYVIKKDGSVIEGFIRSFQ